MKNSHFLGEQTMHTCYSVEELTCLGELTGHILCTVLKTHVFGELRLHSLYCAAELVLFFGEVIDYSIV